MAKFGRGLNREIVAAVNRGELSEPLTTASVRRLAALRGYKPTESHILVALANAASDSHNPTYRKYYLSLGGGRHRVRDGYHGSVWR